MQGSVVHDETDGMRFFYSVLEPSRTLTLAEKSSTIVEEVVAHPNFRIIATMNPGGDFGKKELSPALSNRFTTIWIPAVDERSELLSIISSKLFDGLKQLSPVILEFWLYYQTDLGPHVRQMLSVRELLQWIEFINLAGNNLSPVELYWHGAMATVVDGLGLGTGVHEKVR